MSVTDPVRRKKRVLVVDDDLMSRKVAAAILHKTGFEAYHADNGVMACQALRTRRYDLLLLDWVMPLMNGEELTRQVRSGCTGEHHCNIPIIAVTADLVLCPREHCMRAGVNEYMVKPIDFKLLSTCAIALTTGR